MKQKLTPVFVRADFPLDGNFRPICFVNNRGISIYIKHIEKIEEKIFNRDRGTVFYCTTRGQNSVNVILVFCKFMWHIME